MRGLRENGNKVRRPSVEEDELSLEMDKKRASELKRLETRKHDRFKAALHKINNQQISREIYDVEIEAAEKEWIEHSERAQTFYAQETARLVEQLCKAEERQQNAEERVQELFARERSSRKLGRER